MTKNNFNKSDKTTESSSHGSIIYGVTFGLQGKDASLTGFLPTVIFTITFSINTALAAAK
jgi:hypothetical protein